MRVYFPDGSSYGMPPYTDEENAEFLAGFLAVAEGVTQLTMVSSRQHQEQDASGTPPPTPQSGGAGPESLVDQSPDPGRSD